MGYVLPILSGQPFLDSAPTDRESQPENKVGINFLELSFHGTPDEPGLSRVSSNERIIACDESWAADSDYLRMFLGESAMTGMVLLVRRWYSANCG